MAGNTRGEKGLRKEARGTTRDMGRVKEKGGYGLLDRDGRRHYLSYNPQRNNYGWLTCGGARSRRGDHRGLPHDESRDGRIRLPRVCIPGSNAAGYLLGWTHNALKRESRLVSGRLGDGRHCGHFGIGRLRSYLAQSY